MAKKSMIAREVKREKLVAKFAEKRAALKAIINVSRQPLNSRNCHATLLLFVCTTVASSPGVHTLITVY